MTDGSRLCSINELREMICELMCDRESGSSGEADFLKNVSADGISIFCDEAAKFALNKCLSANLYISCAESLTGGLLSDAFVRIPGASEVFLGSAVTYATEEKISMLSVDRTVAEKYGVVSFQTANLMALGSLKLYSSASKDFENRVISLSTTGVAGPGFQEGKPAGLFYVGCSRSADFFKDFVFQDFASFSPADKACRSIATPELKKAQSDDKAQSDGDILQNANPEKSDPKKTNPQLIAEAYEFRFCSHKEKADRQTVRRLAVANALHVLCETLVFLR